jgi:AcrR family transcriptional regulator
MPALLTDEKILQVRGRIVQVAGQQAVERGLDRVSMHSIAQALGWSASALYRYFANKEAVLAAAQAAAMDELSDRLERAMEGSGDVWERSRAVGNVYVDFAFAEPAAYKLIFGMSQPDRARHPDLVEAVARGRRNMIRYVENMVHEGGLDADPVLLAHVFWAALHGAVSLELAGKLGHDAPDFQTIRRDMVRRIVHSAIPHPHEDSAR